MLKIARISAMALTLWASAVSVWAADGSSKAVFAYGAINAFMTTTWVAREQGFFRKHSVEVEPVFIIASRAARAMLAAEVHVGLIGRPMLPTDKRKNEFAVGERLRIFSAYDLRDGTRLWVITEADRSSTCILMPWEY